MPQRILLPQGHPDPDARHLCHALADAYAEGALAAGHAVRRVGLAALDVPLLRSQHAWEHGEVPPALAPVQDDLRWAGHLVLVFPLWLGDMPALVKACLEQLMRPGFAFRYREGRSPFTDKGLAGRSARVVVTMGMPAVAYRFWFRAHGVKALERNVLGFVGFAPVQQTLVGSVGQLAPEGAQEWLRKLRRLGEAAA